MDDLLSEKEQLEQIRAWWREYGWYLAGGVALGAAILFGMRQYDNYQQNSAEAASAIYQEFRLAVADDADTEALSLLAQLRSDYPDSPYTGQAGLLVVILHLQNQSTRQAIDALSETLESTTDEQLAQIARVRLARLLVSAGRYDEAMNLLDGAEPGRFAARFNELRGDIFYAQGDPQSARTQYTLALNSTESDLVDRGLIQMKLDDLAVTPALEAGAGAPAEDDAG